MATLHLKLDSTEHTAPAVPAPTSVTVEPKYRDASDNASPLSSSSTSLSPPLLLSSREQTQELWDYPDGENIRVKLVENIWHEFRNADAEPEMIITRGGRCMFPIITLCVKGLDESLQYTMALDMIPADDSRYKFVNGEWLATGKALDYDNSKSRMCYVHPESPLPGKMWMKQPVKFKRMKLTNNAKTAAELPNHILLHSMHKYLPRVIITVHGTEDHTSSVIHSHIFHECQFVATTAYQNDQVTQIKINHNPFAKGFRPEEEADRSNTTAIMNELSARGIIASDPLEEVWTQGPAQFLPQPATDIPHTYAYQEPTLYQQPGQYYESSSAAAMPQWISMRAAHDPLPPYPLPFLPSHAVGTNVHSLSMAPLVTQPLSGQRFPTLREHGHLFNPKYSDRTLARALSNTPYTVSMLPPASSSVETGPPSDHPTPHDKQQNRGQ